jgi:hypothetical protein
MVDSHSRNTSALTALNLETGDETTLAENPRVDVNFHITYQNLKLQ